MIDNLLTLIEKLGSNDLQRRPEEYENHFSELLATSEKKISKKLNLIQDTLAQNPNQNLKNFYLNEKWETSEDLKAYFSKLVEQYKYRRVFDTNEKVSLALKKNTESAENEKINLYSYRFIK